jgi:hypothetical protein
LNVKLNGEALFVASTHFHPLEAEVLVVGSTSFSVSFLNHNLGFTPVATLTPEASIIVAVTVLASVQIVAVLSAEIEIWST